MNNEVSEKARKESRKKARKEMSMKTEKTENRKKSEKQKIEDRSMYLTILDSLSGVVFRISSRICSMSSTFSMICHTLFMN